MVRGLAWRWVMSRSVKYASIVGAKVVIAAGPATARKRSAASPSSSGAGVQIPVGVGGIGMAKVGRQQTQLAGRVGSLTMPVADGGDREGVSQAVDLRSSAIGLGFESDLDQELAEHVVHRGVKQPRPTDGDEETGRLGVWAELVANLQRRRAVRRRSTREAGAGGVCGTSLAGYPAPRPEGPRARGRGRSPHRSSCP